MAEEKKTDATQLTDAQIKEQVDKLSQTTQGATPPVFEVKLETGQVYRGKTQEELIQQLTKAQEEASKLIKKQKDGLSVLEGQLTAVRTQVNPESPPKNGGQFNATEYWNLMATNPVEAADYLDRFRYGAERTEVVESIRKAQAVAEEFEQHKAVAIFLGKHPEFPGGNDVAEKILTRLNERELGVSADNLELSYLSLVNEGEIKPTPIESVNQQQQAGTQPPPELTGSSGSAPDTSVVEKAENMSTADLEKLLRGLGVLK